MTTRIIVGLSGGTIDGKDVPMEQVAVKVWEVFMTTPTEPFCEVTMHCQIDLKKVLVGVVVLCHPSFWSLQNFCNFYIRIVSTDIECVHI